jgi:hypothetical protein
MDRVFKRNGVGNVLIIAPHGHPSDDKNSDVVSQSIANYLNCDTIINCGWRRNSNPIVDNNLANCNDVNHCKTEPVFSEFLKPIQENLNSKISLYGWAFVFLIHGMSDNIRNNIPNVDAIVGWGNGNPPKYTCSIPNKNNFISKMNNIGLYTIESQIGGKFGAYNDLNLTQFLKSNAVQCLQLELVWQKRKDTNTAIETGKKIGMVIDELLL